MKIRRTRGTFLGVALVLAGCGSSRSSGSVADAGGGTPVVNPGEADSASCSGSDITWKDDGAVDCASSWEGIRSTGNMSDTLEIIATRGTMGGLSLLFGSDVTLGGTYNCVPGASVVEITYSDAQENDKTVQSCDVTLSFTESDAGVVYAVGTFSVVLGSDGGATKNLTDGMFDLPIITDDGG
jgi:hypothetical protein